MYALVTTLFLLAAESDSPRIIPMSKTQKPNRAHNHSLYLYKTPHFQTRQSCPLDLMPDVHRKP